MTTTDKFDPFTATASDLQRLLQSETLSSEQLVQLYLSEIAQNDGYLRAVTTMPPLEWLFAEARKRDQELRDKRVRGPLHGIPIVVEVGSRRALERRITY